MLADIDPLTANDRLLSAGAFKGQMLSNYTAAAEALGLTYEGKVTAKPSKFPCIAETNAYASKGVPQHFFVVLGSSIIDPLDGKEYPANKYLIKSYRLFYKPEVNTKMLKNLFQLGNDIVWNVRSHNIVIDSQETLDTLFGADQINPNPDPALLKDAKTYRLTWQNQVDLESYRKTAMEAPTDIADAFTLGVKQGVKDAPVKEVIKEVTKEVKVPAEQLTALEHLKLALKGLFSWVGK